MDEDDWKFIEDLANQEAFIDENGDECTFSDNTLAKAILYLKKILEG